MRNKETVIVTGGNGFLGMRIVLQLLQKGYRVRTTVRSSKNKDKLISVLKANGITEFDDLSFAEVDLTSDKNWAEAMSGCRYVLSVASPVFFDDPKHEEEAVRPAVDGILRILRFAQKEGVQRVVMTSNFGAVGFSQTDKNRETTEADWTDLRTKGLSVYERSKTMAEKAAWGFINNEGGNLEFTTINAVGIWGPSLDAHVSGSFHLLQNLLNGSMKAIPNIPLNVADVRDVADLHIRAMITEAAGGQRFIASANGKITLPQIAALLRAKRPEVSQKVSARVLPDWVIRLGALFSPRAKEGLMFIKMNRNVSNQKAKTFLNWKHIASQEETLLAAVDSLVKYNLIHKQV